MTARSEARDRLLDAASELFYREGINGVGVDRVLDAAGVTRATMYRHFTGKEALVVAYLDREDRALRDQFAAASAGGGTPDQLLAAIVHGIAQDIRRHHTRGCPFINAAAEFPDADSPVRSVVADHRAWFRATLAEVTRAAGLADPDEAAAALVLLRDAALVGGYLDGVDGVAEAFVAAAGRVTGREF